jgi:hypothetical protein
MMKTGAILCLVIYITASANGLDASYNRAVENSEHYNSQAMSKIKTTDIKTINTNVPESEYRSKMSSQESSKEFALSSPLIKAQHDSAIQTVNNREPMDKNTISTAYDIANNAENVVGNDGYCINGDCHQLDEIEHSDEMIQTSAVLNDVLGGGQSFNESGKQAKIYTGKSEKCKKDNWGFADCCRDDGWGVDLSLANCPKKTKDLGKLKEKGLCHYVGKYKEKVRVGGVVVRVDEYKGYCCYPSKMARLTQEGAKPQLGMSWGAAKYPSCQGLTSDQFAKLDFSKIDLSEVYGDIEKTIVEPSQDDLIKQPGEYYKEKGISSW